MSFSCPKKEIIYRGGVVRFFIPKHWLEEYEEQGGGTFYEPGDDTGTLRLNVLSFLTKEDFSPEQLLATVQNLGRKNGGAVEVLPGQRFLSRYRVNSMENGVMLAIFRWEIAKMVSPRDYNIAAFTFTVREKKMKSGLMLEEISSIDEEIQNVSFGMHADSCEL